MGQLTALGGPLEAIPALLDGALVLLLQDVADESPDGARDVIDVLGLDGGLDVVLQYLSEEVLEFGPPEVYENLLPVRGGIVLA